MTRRQDDRMTSLGAIVAFNEVILSYQGLYTMITFE